MFVLVTLTYTAPIDDVVKHTPAHRAYVKTLHESGKLLASGPFVPRTGGLLLLRVEEESEVAAIIAGDPFHREGLANHEARVWAPTLGAEALASLATGT